MLTRLVVCTYPQNSSSILLILIFSILHLREKALQLEEQLTSGPFSTSTTTGSKDPIVLSDPNMSLSYHQIRTIPAANRCDWVIGELDNLTPWTLHSFPRPRIGHHKWKQIRSRSFRYEVLQCDHILTMKMTRPPGHCYVIIFHSNSISKPHSEHQETTTRAVLRLACSDQPQRLIILFHILPTRPFDFPCFPSICTISLFITLQPRSYEYPLVVKTTA